ncbi:DUF2375 domain-containing protein [Alginatibacterium sediminis]|uniref:DUF2375 domain-containing protein n=1 Tax=Alginatibacterium sediminis TaxID=2164068 RepID=A0A420E7E3_9ALTE|nr:DUF2375 family protein [Alginatibacterium sediminis]RKF14442.1 DUF2375 domain-containing protein [Alginatibacterium sediminis]
MDITVLYYDKKNPLELQSMHMEAADQQSGGRLVIDPQRKQDKIILAILEGEVSVLNALGQRIIP